jgi:hypothetical protein
MHEAMKTLFYFSLIGLAMMAGCAAVPGRILDGPNEMTLSTASRDVTIGKAFTVTIRIENIGTKALLVPAADQIALTYEFNGSAPVELVSFPPVSSSTVLLLPPRESVEIQKQVLIEELGNGEFRSGTARVYPRLRPSTYLLLNVTPSTR